MLPKAIATTYSSVESNEFSKYSNAVEKSDCIKYTIPIFPLILKTSLLEFLMNSRSIQRLLILFLLLHLLVTILLVLALALLKHAEFAKELQLLAYRMMPNLSLNMT